MRTPWQQRTKASGFEFDHRNAARRLGRTKRGFATLFSARSVFLVTLFIGSLLGRSVDAQPALDGDPSEARVQVRVVTPFAPFVRTSWDWRTRERTRMWVATRELGAGAPIQSSVALAESANWEAAWSQVMAACTPNPAFSTAPPLDPLSVGADLAGALVEVHLAGEGLETVHWEAVLSADLAALALDPRVACIEALRGPVRGRTSFPVYRPPWWSREDVGLLRVDADRPAWIWVNGRQTGERTPMTDFALPPGLHEVRWVSVTGDVERVQQVRVERGRTTTIRVRLLPEDGDGPYVPAAVRDALEP